MANPKRKISRSKRDKRKANWYASIKPAGLSECGHCGAQKLPHRACPECGYYHGRRVFEPKGV